MVSRQLSSSPLLCPSPDCAGRETPGVASCVSTARGSQGRRRPRSSPVAKGLVLTHREQLGTSHSPESVPLMGRALWGSRPQGLPRRPAQLAGTPTPLQGQTHQHAVTRCGVRARSRVLAENAAQSALPGEGLSRLQVAFRAPSPVSLHPVWGHGPWALRREGVKVVLRFGKLEVVPLCPVILFSKVEE